MSSIKTSPSSTTQDVVPGGTSDDFSKSTDHRYGCLVASFDDRFKNGFHAEAVAGTERVELTNPGIIERLHQDIQDYLSIHGFRLENNRCKGKSTISDGGSGMDESSPDIATLFIPRLTYIYDDSENRGECQTMSSTQEGKIFADTTLARAGAGNDAPLGTLVLHVQEESVLHTVGPLLRTYLRLSSHSINPRRLRAVVNCRFVLKSQQKQLQRNNNRHMQSIETMVANRMAHHIHMIIRNSMGSALCLDLVVVLPFYRTDIDDQLIDEASFDNDFCQNRNDVDGSTLVPVSKKAIQIAMDNNRDACYPTVQLVERKDGLDNNYDSCNNGEGRKMTSTEYEGIASTLHLDVSTRMCTVRHQPSLFKWVTTLSGQHCSANFEEEVDRCKQSTYTDYPSNTTVDIIHDENNDNGEGPLIVACIEKVANLHRILMLCHDYYDEKKMELDDCLMNNMIVVIPGDGRDVDTIDKNYVECRATITNVMKASNSDAAKDENNNDNDPKINRNREKRGKRNKILSPKMKDEKLMREFEEAIVNFHNVILRQFNEAGNGDQRNQKNRRMRYHPILVFESRAVEVLSSMIRGRQKAMTPITTSGDSPSKSSTTTSPMQNTLLVGIDLHPKALTLHGGRYCQPHSTIRQQQSKPSENQNQRQASKCRALRMMQRSDAIVFGYESSGIPKALSEVLNGWVEIPSRSSINVVAAMSIVLDTLFRG